MRIGLLAFTLLLAGCGAERRLRPAAGQALPPKPAMAPTQPSADDLLKQAATARPGRSDELLTRSQPRGEDRFDLPPQ